MRIARTRFGRIPADQAIERDDDDQDRQDPRRQQERGQQHPAEREQLRQRVPPMQPAVAGQVVTGCRGHPLLPASAGRCVRGGHHALTAASPRLNIVRTVIGSAPRMKKTIV